MERSLHTPDLPCRENGVRAAIEDQDSFAGHAGLVLLDDLLHDVVTTNANRFIGCTGVRPVRTNRAVHIVAGSAVIHGRRPVDPWILTGVTNLSGACTAEHAPWIFTFLQPSWYRDVFLGHKRQSVQTSNVYPFNLEITSMELEVAAIFIAPVPGESDVSGLRRHFCFFLDLDLPGR